MLFYTLGPDGKMVGLPPGFIACRGMVLPHPTTATKPCPAPPHTPSGVVVGQISCHGCHTRASVR
jgi:hypothetical protein